MKETSKPYDLKFIRLIFNCYFRNSSTKQKLHFIKAVIKKIFGVQLKEISIALTYRCQFRCKHCCMGLFEKSKRKELSLTEIKQIIDNVASDFGTISLMGGEPLMRKKEVIELVKYASSKGLFVVLDSNGLYLDYNTIKRLKKGHLSHIYISLDTALEEEHDSLRNFKGAYSNALKAMDNCRKAGLPFLVSTYATKEKLVNGDLLKLIEKAREKKAAGVRILDPKLAGRWLEREDLRFDGQDRILLKKILHSGFVFYECKENISKYPLCFTVTKNYAYISPYGDIQPCPLVPISFGNLRKDDLVKTIQKMWEHKMFKNFSETTCLINNPNFRNKYLKNISTKTHSLISIDTINQKIPNKKSS